MQARDLFITDSRYPCRVNIESTYMGIVVLAPHAWMRRWVTYTTATSTDWVMTAIALRPATSTSVGGGTSASSTTVRYVHTDDNLVTH